MERARLNGLYLLLLGACPLFLLLGFILVTTSPIPMVDFRAVYYPARCLIQNCDPYREDQVQRVYQAEEGEKALESTTHPPVVTHYMYPPTSFALTVPFALLPWGIARVVWLLLTVGSLIFASLLAWDLGADHAPILSGILIGFLLANSEVLVNLCNPSGIAISLCVIAVWCFIRERFVPAGILCLAFSLALKPQVAGMIWLYFLLAGGVYRKRALQTLLATVAISLPGVLWVWRVAPQWMQELHSNIEAFAVHGGLNDPGQLQTGLTAWWTCRWSSASSATTLASTIRSATFYAPRFCWHGGLSLCDLTPRFRDPGWQSRQSPLSPCCLFTTIYLTPSCCCSQFPRAPCYGPRADSPAGSHFW
jgi:hypothetical protein